jgi:Polyketide cyclase / dehydrase and lipid transport
MAPITSTIDIACPPDAVFAYATDPTRFGEWQKDVVGGHSYGEGPVGVGSTCTTTRLIRGVERTTRAEITELHAPERWAARGIDGPVRPIIDLTIEQLAEDRSRVTIDLGFDGRGVGKLAVGAVRRAAEQELAENCAALKERLEARQAG